MSKEVIHVNVGDRFGKLTVVGSAIRKDGRIFYPCQCDCGSPVTEKSKYNLLSGATSSCGCKYKEVDYKKMIKAWKANRISFGCVVCGSSEHYAKKMCRNCYDKARRGTLYKEIGF